MKIRVYLTILLIAVFCFLSTPVSAAVIVDQDLTWESGGSTTVVPPTNPPAGSVYKNAGDSLGSGRGSCWYYFSYGSYFDSSGYCPPTSGDPVSTFGAAGYYKLYQGSYRISGYYDDYEEEYVYYVSILSGGVSGFPRYWSSTYDHVNGNIGDYSAWVLCAPSTVVTVPPSTSTIHVLVTKSSEWFGNYNYNLVCKNEDGVTASYLLEYKDLRGNWYHPAIGSDYTGTDDFSRTIPREVYSDTDVRVKITVDGDERIVSWSPSGDVAIIDNSTNTSITPSPTPPPTARPTIPEFGGGGGDNPPPTFRPDKIIPPPTSSGPVNLTQYRINEHIFKSSSESVTEIKTYIRDQSSKFGLLSAAFIGVTDIVDQISSLITRGFTFFLSIPATPLNWLADSLGSSMSWMCSALNGLFGYLSFPLIILTAVGQMIPPLLLNLVALTILIEAIFLGLRFFLPELRGNIRVDKKKR